MFFTVLGLVGGAPLGPDPGETRFDDVTRKPAVWCSARSATFRSPRGKCSATPPTRVTRLQPGPGSRTARRATSTPRPSSRTACTAAGASSPRVISRGSRSRASASSAATRTSPTRPPTPTTTHASTTANKPTYPLAGGSPPLRFPRRAPPKTRIDYSYSGLWPRANAPYR